MLVALEDSLEAQHLRKVMVATQIRSRGIQNAAVLTALETVPRHCFGQFTTLNEAYADNPARIGCEQTISQPYIVGFMTEALEVQSHHKILEIGTGSGYQTAILCELAQQIFSIERHSALSSRARHMLDALNYQAATLIIGDGSKGLPEIAPFDRILVTAAAPHHPETLINQLSVHNGVIVFPRIRHKHQELIKIRRTGLTQFETIHLGWVKFVPLIIDE